MRYVLLWLLALITCAVQGAEPVVSAEAKECFDWFATLGFPDVKDAIFAEVWTGTWHEDGAKPPVSVTAAAYVLSNEGSTFVVIGHELLQRVLTSTDKTAKSHKRIGYEARSFADYARRQLELLQHPTEDRWSGFGARLGMKTKVFFLAFNCWRKGEAGLAQELFDESLKLEARRSGSDGKEVSMRAALEQELGLQAMWDAVLRFGGRGLGGGTSGDAGHLIPRAGLLEAFQRIVRLFPQSQHAERARRTAAILEKMVAEDQTHRVLADGDLVKLRVEEQVSELIFQLRDQHGEQGDEPGWCSILGMSEKSKTPADRLVGIGFPAVPQLIEALADERFSRSVGCHRSYYFSHTVLTIGDCAQQILNRIGDREFYRPKSTSSYMSSDGEVEATQKVVRSWWEAFQAKGERQSMIDAINSDNHFSATMIARLKAKYPDAVEPAVLGAAGRTKIENRLLYFIDLAGGFQSAAAREYLLSQFKNGSTTKVRVAAARQLRKDASADVLPGVIQEWLRLPRSLRSEGESGLLEVLDFLCASGLASAIEQVSAEWDTRSAYERFEIMQRLGYWLTPEWTRLRLREPEPAAKLASIALLARALEDTGRGGDETWGGSKFGYKNPRICDEALAALHRIDPKGYAFSDQAGLLEHDVERVTAANVWRRANGRSLLPELASLPRPPPDQALKITTIEIRSAQVDQALSDKVKNLRGTPFTTQTLRSLILWYARNRVEVARGVILQARRGDDLQGMEISVEIDPVVRPGSARIPHVSYSIREADQRRDTGSGTFPLEIPPTRGDWEAIEGNIERCLQLPPRTPLEIRVEVR